MAISWCLHLMESICRFYFSCQNRFPGRSLCCIDGIAFVVSVGVAIVLVAAIHLIVHKHQNISL